MSNDELIKDVEKLFQMLKNGKAVASLPQDNDFTEGLVADEKDNFLKKIDKNRLVFEYKRIAACGYVGMPAGKSLSVYGDGSIVYRQYVISKENWEAIDKEEIIACIPEASIQIRKIIEEYHSVLSSIPSKLDNHSVDGSFDTFVFLDKTIKGLNVCKHRTIPRILYPDPDRFTNMVLDFYNVVLDILNSFGIETYFEKE